MNTSKNFVQSQIVAELGGVINKIAGPLSETIEEVSGRMPEKIFREYFLPRIFEPHKYEREDWQAQWVAIASNPMCPIRILDDKTGAVLFVAPPLFYGPGVNTQTRRPDKNDPGMYAVVNQYHMLRDRSKQEAAEFSEDALGRMGRQYIGNHSESNRYLGLWEEIFKRYGLKRVSAEEIPDLSPQDDDDDLDSLIEG